MFRLFLLFLFVLFAGEVVLSQDLKRARGIVETLSLPYFHGRGYVNKGDSLASEFLVKEFMRAGLKPFNSSYFQEFSFPVNTFPGKMEVKINRRKLVPGKDFILDPASKGIKGKFKIISPDSASIYGNKVAASPDKQRALLYPAEWRRKNSNVLNNFSSCPVHIQKTPKKLTFSVAGEAKDGCIIQLLHSSLPAKHSKLKVDIENKQIDKHTARNVIGYVEGTSDKDSFIVITAHYDHLGQLGKDTYFPGANDNASGIAMLTELAGYFAKPENRLQCSVLFIGFAGEEAGLLGSTHYVQHPLFPLTNIKFLLNLDLLGSGKEGITVVNGSVFTSQFSLLDSLNRLSGGLPKITPRGKAANSDHYPFSESGVPAFFIYTNGEITAYHDINDTPEVVTFSKFREVFALLTAFLKKM